MPDPDSLLPSQDLWQRVLRVTNHALASGALVPVETDFECIEQDGVRFLLRVASNLRRKKALRPEPQPASDTGRFNPFLPPEPALLVGDISPSHRAVLNKFNVMPHHLLLVTRAFEHQECLLNPKDFAALGACLMAFPSLGFYNGGAVAGASQPHKHLQLVPLPLGGGELATPIQPLLDAAAPGCAIGQVPGLGYAHAFCRLETRLWEHPERAARAACERYRALLDNLRIGTTSFSGETRQSAPYNLLMTRDWMLLIPRLREHAEGISINALGFAGSLFVNAAADKQRLIALGPMRALERVAGRAEETRVASGLPQGVP
jgi:ATP adenylyltransferase